MRSQLAARPALYEAKPVGIALLLLCLPSILCLERCKSSISPRRAACQPGTLPGRWLYDGNLMSWSVFQPECQLEDLAGTPSLPNPNSTAPHDEVGILLVGDSVDRFMVTDTCSAHEFGEDEWAHDVDSFCICRKSNYTVARQAFIGVDPKGPWFQHDTGSPAERITHGLSRYEAYVGRPPDVITLSSAFWDLASWTEHNPILIASPLLSPDLLSLWGSQLSDVMSLIEEKAPDALWIFRTSAPPQLKDCTDGTGSHDNPLLGKHSHVVDLNSMARDIARQHEWAVIDYERLAAPFHHSIYFLRDHHHPDQKMLLAALNIMLNLYRSSCPGVGLARLD